MPWPSTRTWLLDAGTAAIRRVFAAALDAPKGAGEAAVHGGPRPVDFVGVVELGQEDLMEPEPDAGLLPVVEPAPAGHAGSAAHLDGEVLPGDARLEDEEDARQRFAVVETLATGVAEAAGLGGQQRLQEIPKFIGDKRLGHDSTSVDPSVGPGRHSCEYHAQYFILLQPLNVFLPGAD